MSKRFNKIRKIKRAVFERVTAARKGFPDWLAGLPARLQTAGFVGELDLHKKVRSDTVVIFGSGFSLNSISQREWDTLKEFNVIGFNWFIHQKWIPCDFQIVKAAGVSSNPSEHVEIVTKYFSTMAGNEFFSNTTLITQTGLSSSTVNRAFALGLLPARWRIFPFSIRRGQDHPTRSFSEGLVHPISTLFCALNFAMLMPWKRIILAGVDLYDSRYFWLPPEATTETQVKYRNATATTPHSTIRNGVVELMKQWKLECEKRGIEIYILNPKSLLVEVLPLWNNNSNNIG